MLTARHIHLQVAIVQTGERQQATISLKPEQGDRCFTLRCAVVLQVKKQVRRSLQITVVCMSVISCLLYLCDKVNAAYHL